MTDEVVKFYAVVEFDEWINNKKAVELVPASWLTSEEDRCYWPPDEQEVNIQVLIADEVKPSDNWDLHPIVVIAKAKDYEQGLRRLKRSFKKMKDIESSESESQSARDNHATMSSAKVTRKLASPMPMTKRKASSMIDFVNVMDTVEETGDEFLSDRESLVKIPNENFTNFDDVAQHLQSVIVREMEKTRRSINYSITERFKEIAKTLQYSAENPINNDAWKAVSEGMPFKESEEFTNFDKSLEDNAEQKNALLETFKMVTAGSTKFGDDVIAIMGKLIKKNVQLLYSGCGKKRKGVGKLSFSDTQTFKIMDQFLKAKYVNAKEKVSTLTAVSRYLSGANDREGGRAHRDAQI